jgi:hypothetical protein
LGHPAAGNPLGRHVGLASDVGLCYASDQVSRDAEIADLDLSAGVDEDVGRLDISMDDIVVILECLQTLRCSVCDFPENVLGNAISVEFVD